MPQDGRGVEILFEYEMHDECRIWCTYQYIIDRTWSVAK